MKECFKCLVSKDESEFYRHPKMGDGLLGKCKDCTKKDTSSNYKSNLKYYKEYDRKRNNLDHRKKKFSEQSKKFRKENPDKYRAHSVVNNALRTGSIKKGPCIVCGNMFVDAHHEDYTKPLEVIWVCRQHHHDIHKKKIAI